MRRRAVAVAAVAATVAVVALVAVALADALGSSSRMRVVGRHRVVGIVLTEYRLAPDSIRASRGLLTFVVRNRGRRTHNLVVTLDGRMIGATSRPLWPGQRERFTLGLVPGTYVLASTILNDQSLGEYGKLIVR
jgi:hypothetical protein